MTAERAPRQPELAWHDKTIANSDKAQMAAALAVIKDLKPGWTGPAERIFHNDHFGLPLDHPNRIGAWVRYAAQLGLIEKVGYQPASKASRNGGVVAVWRRCRDGE